MVHLTSDWVGDQGPIRDRRGTDTLNMCSKPGEGALDLGFWLVPPGGLDQTCDAWCGFGFGFGCACGCA
jgi:hypothetical protein